MAFFLVIGMCWACSFRGEREYGRQVRLVANDEINNIPRTYSVKGEGDSAFVRHLACIDRGDQIGSQSIYIFCSTQGAQWRFHGSDEYVHERISKYHKGCIRNSGKLWSRCIAQPRIGSTSAEREYCPKTPLLCISTSTSNID